MSELTLSPMFGWVISPVLAVAIVTLAVAGMVHAWRQRPDTDATALGWTRRLLIALVLAVMLLTPSTVVRTQSRAVNATDVFIAVDVTGSMAVKDAHYGGGAITRLEAAGKVVNDVTARYPDASFAAIGFGTSATLDVPITPDARAIDNWARTLQAEPTSTSSGSNLDKAVDVLLPTMKTVRQQHPDDTIIVVYISDGEQNTNQTRRTFSSLRAYADTGISVGVGSTAGGNIPRIGDDGKVIAGQYVKDPSTGSPDVSKLDEKNLKAIADEMSGSYVHVDANRVIGEQDAAEASKDYRMTQTHKSRTHTVPVVWPFAAALCALLVWEALDWMAKSRRLL
ncbi:VWA domain-containing protein [Bifidobacterium margollesii]|uniref:VWA domain-containing protein n=1 Tax=Bifidobacterium margollesii TaxID=2020964 RepID=A0A2N5J7G8_9BIFI|nr:vWA domain-containing protein [Bifidobacterium margollesii]PLS30137.1 VWA domain-containing protein [Bifidobacterium margollesii]